MTIPPDRPLRGDAERNRRLILDTADRMLAQRGSTVTLNEIAREAGLGVGTVYRRFADLESIIDVLFGERFAHFVDIAENAQQEADPGHALTGYILTAAAWRAGDPGLETILGNARLERPEVAEFRNALGSRIDRLVASALEAEAVHADFASADVYNMLFMLGAVADRTEATSPGAWRRYAVVLLAGFGLETADGPGAMTDDELLRAWPQRR
ncbi:MAG: TetR/AcrR family transcriptional regulator [Renibacterium sp.]|nr:TetR/AcrR family transcriptional regulator [Renibacterium sp.]